jgi:ankyrin repeat protein
MPSQDGHRDVAQALLENGAEVNATAACGGTALIIASQTRNIELTMKGRAFKLLHDPLSAIHHLQAAIGSDCAALGTGNRPCHTNPSNTQTTHAE